MRIIDADAMMSDTLQEYENSNQYRNAIIRMINKAPTIDAVEVVRGEWIYCEDYVGQDGYKCSACGYFAPWHYNVYDIDYISNYHYCPNCGAQMKGADDE